MRHDHDGGFAADLPSLLGQRHLLMLLGAALATRPAMALDCTALPWETAGPYPAGGTDSRAG